MHNVIAARGLIVSLGLFGPASLSSYGQAEPAPAGESLIDLETAPAAVRFEFQPVLSNPAGRLLAQVISGTSVPAAAIEDIKPAYDPENTAGTVSPYISAAAAPAIGLRLEIFADDKSLEARRASLPKNAPRFQYFSGFYSGGSVLLRVAPSVAPDLPATYGQNLTLTLLVSQ